MRKIMIFNYNNQYREGFILEDMGDKILFRQTKGGSNSGDPIPGYRTFFKNKMKSVGNL